MQSVAIAGVGLIGGSFGLALRRAGFGGRILGVSSPKTIRTAIERGAIDEGADFTTAVASADLVFLSAPILVILDQIDGIEATARPGALITDAGSTKALICRKAQEKIRRSLFLGGHPLAGKERSGIAAADAELFEGRTWAVCPSQDADVEDDRVREFFGWVRRIGARIEVLSAEDHDETVALTSHLPQLLSTALAASLRDARRAPDLAGPGLFDMTRLAASPYGVWRDILVTNEPAIRGALDAFLKSLSQLTGDFHSSSTETVFQMAESSAERLRALPSA